MGKVCQAYSRPDWSTIFLNGINGLATPLTIALVRV